MMKSNSYIFVFIYTDYRDVLVLHSLHRKSSLKLMLCFQIQE